MIPNITLNNFPIQSVSFELQEEANRYPPTDKTPVVDNFHGTEITDNYRWLEEKNIKTTDWVRSQHAFTLSQIKQLPQVDWLSSRYNQLLRYDDQTVPKELMKGERVFFSTKSIEQDRWVYCTKKNSAAPTEIVLNPNSWPSEQTLDVTSPSNDGRYLAYGIAKGGDENPVVRIRDLETGALLEDTLYGRKHSSISWHPDNAGFFYTAHPAEGDVPEGEEVYWNSVYYHKLDTLSYKDKKVFSSSTDKEHYHSAYFTEDGKYEVFYRSEFSKSEVLFRPAGSKDALTPLAVGFDGDYSIEIYQDKIYILTDANAPMKQLFVTDITKPDRANWTVVIPENEKSKIDGFGIIEGKLYVNRLENANTRIEIFDLEGTYIKDVPLPGIGSASVRGFQDAKPGVRLTFTSFIHPTETFKYDFKTDSLTSIHRTPIEVDTDRYETKQVWVTSKDGTKVSMFIISNKDAPLDGNNPTYLTGYGGFDISETPYFSTTYLLWLEAGGVIAIPNLRGGGEYGQQWHEGGMKEKKQNVFDDFIASAEYLITEKITSPKKLAIGGGSNGGLLVGAVMTQRPELFNAVLCQVPLLDMVNYHKFGLANIWETEYGSSESPEAFEYLLKYSPYHSIKEGESYPATLITAGENDARVDPCHASKMVAGLQNANSSESPIMLYSESSSGHGGGTTLTQVIEQRAHHFAFLMSQLGM